MSDEDIIIALKENGLPELVIGRTEEILRLGGWTPAWKFGLNDGFLACSLVAIQLQKVGSLPASWKPFFLGGNGSAENRADIALVRSVVREKLNEGPNEETHPVLRQLYRDFAAFYALDEEQPSQWVN